MNSKAKFVLAAAMIAFGGSAFANEDMPMLKGYVGKDKAEIMSTLKGKGYEVRKVEPEDGYLEAYAMKGGKRYEIYVDTKTGEVAKVKDD